MLVKFGYMILGAMVLILVWALCVEVRDTWREIRHWWGGGKL